MMNATQEFVNEPTRWPILMQSVQFVFGQSIATTANTVSGKRGLNSQNFFYLTRWHWTCRLWPYCPQHHVPRIQPSSPREEMCRWTWLGPSWSSRLRTSNWWQLGRRRHRLQTLRQDPRRLDSRWFPPSRTLCQATGSSEILVLRYLKNHIT